MNQMNPYPVSGCYVLPATQDGLVLLPVSGGADSSALAILMHQLYPEMAHRMLLVFTDTGDGVEDPGVYKTLERLQAYLNKPIFWIEPERGLFEVIESYGNFLPSATDRYCTRIAKLVPFQRFIRLLKTNYRQIFALIAIRADEGTRLALTDADIQTEMPFIDLGIQRADVFSILSQTIGIPNYYQRRVRSGCGICFFQRRSEKVGLLLQQPQVFEQGVRLEKLSEQDANRHAAVAKSVTDEVGLSLNHLTLPLPDRLRFTSDQAISVKWGKHSTKQGSLFDPRPMTGLYVGAEFFINSTMGQLIWMQRIVTFSRSISGIRRSLQNHYAHRLDTAEVWGIDREQMIEELKLVVYFIEVPSELLDASPVSSESFTFAQGESYLMLKHVISWANRTLQVAGLKQQLEQTALGDLLSWQFEQHQLIASALDRLAHPVGEVLAMDVFEPAPPSVDDEISERQIPCPMCSI